MKTPRRPRRAARRPRRLAGLVLLLCLALLLAACQPANVATPTPAGTPPSVTAVATATLPGASPSPTVAPPVANPTVPPASPTAPAVPRATATSPTTATPPVAASPSPPVPPAGTPAAERVTLVLGSDAGPQVDVEAELAIDREQRSLGLMHRETLPEGTGMLFIFPGDTAVGFWMANTRVALSIAYIATDGTIIGLDDMQPLTTDIHPPPGPYQYALEVPQGYFARHGIEVGSLVRYRDGGTLRPLAELPATGRATW